MSESQEYILVVVSETQLGLLLDRLLRSSGFRVAVTSQGTEALRRASASPASLVILGETLQDGSGIDHAAEFGMRFPSLPVILLVNQESPDLLKRAMRQGVADYVCLPLRADEALRAVRGALALAKRRKDAIQMEARRVTSGLQRQMDEMEILVRAARRVTSSLSLDSVLTAIVDAAVELTGAEEGSLLLIDEQTGDLYIRASRNFQDDFVRTFRLPISDSLAGSVIRTGEAVLLDENTPQKIKTSYLVRSLLYVPLQVQGNVFGVLGVDNRQVGLPLTQKHVRLMNMLASFAVIALENARLYEDVSREHNKLATVLAGIRDGVIVVDQDQRLGIVNQAAREAFSLDTGTPLEGKPFRDVFGQEELHALLRAPDNSKANYTEISPDGNRSFSVEIAPVVGVGRVLTLHDITYLKKLDHIKTDFVHTISHDLRSPLTAILGYVELIERAGPVTDLQKDFIRRVQVSVYNITHLVDDLLTLGRIESGFDVGNELVHIDQLIYYAADGIKKNLAEKGHQLQIRIAEHIPALQANSLQIRQMLDHLMDNAVRYTVNGGTVGVSCQVEQDQVIIQVSDSGIGVPAADLPFIFDKFFRASNANGEMAGTGLGLAIVKSIVENHGGRIWVESCVDNGSTFTIVLPVAQPTVALPDKT